MVEVNLVTAPSLGGVTTGLGSYIEDPLSLDLSVLKGSFVNMQPGTRERPQKDMRGKKLWLAPQDGAHIHKISEALVRHSRCKDALPRHAS